MSIRIATSAVADHASGVFIDGNEFPWAVGTDIEVVEDCGLSGLRMTVFAEQAAIIGRVLGDDPITWKPDAQVAERVFRYAIECGIDVEAADQFDAVARLLVEEGK